MPMTISAGYDPLRRLVHVSVLNAPSTPTLERLDANGRSLVRGFGVNATNPDGTVRASANDREHSFLGPVRYIVSAGTETLYTDATGLEAAPSHPVLSNPLSGRQDVDVLQVRGLSADRTTNATVHQIIGSRFPVVTFDTLTSRAGVLTFLVGHYRAALALTALVSELAIVHLRQADHRGLDMYFNATGTSDTHEAENYWAVSVPYVETAAPVGNAASSRWTWETVTTEHTSWDDLALSYLTWDDVAARRTL